MYIYTAEHLDRILEDERSNYRSGLLCVRRGFRWFSVLNVVNDQVIVMLVSRIGPREIIKNYNGNDGSIAQMNYNTCAVFM